MTYTQPTSEMYEEEIQITTKEQQKNGLGNTPNSGGKWSQF